MSKRLKSLSYKSYVKTCLKLVFRFVLMRLSCLAVGQAFFFVANFYTKNIIFLR